MQITLNRLALGAIVGVVIYLLAVLVTQTILKGMKISLLIGGQIILISSLLGVIIGVISFLILAKIKMKGIIFLFEILVAGLIGGLLYYFTWMYPDLSLKDDTYLTIIIVGIVNGLLIVLLQRIVGWA